MRINEKLNLVIPIDAAAGTIYVHSQPVSREVFEQNFMLVSKTFAAIYNDGLGSVAGPRVAAMLMRSVARDMNGFDRDGKPNPDGPGTEACNAFLAEVRRLSNVLAPSNGGYETIPFQEAVDKKVLAPDDAAEVENAVAFFTVGSAMHRRAEMPAFLDGLTSLWGAQTSPLNCTEYGASLRTSTETESSGVTEAGSSVPS